MAPPTSTRHLTSPAARIDGLGETVFAEMSALAVATGSVNLGQGFPDSDGPPALLAATQQAIATGHIQYPPGLGIPEVVLYEFRLRNQVGIDIHDVLDDDGGKHADDDQDGDYLDHRKPGIVFS